MKKTFAILYITIFISSFLILSTTHKSYSLTCDYAIANLEYINNKYELKYYCNDVNTNELYNISVDDAINYFGERRYNTYFHNNQELYFNKGKQIDYNTYKVGRAEEEADIQAMWYGPAAIRVTSNQDFKNKIDDVFNNHKLGDFHFIWAETANINFDDVYNYYKSKYGLTDVNKNYYKYSLKGDQEPSRMKMPKEELNYIKESRDWNLNTIRQIRINNEEKNHTDRFLNQIIPLMTSDNPSTAEKVYRALYYINKYSYYEVDNGFEDNMIITNTSIYDALIERSSVCIGFAITFSYMMDKMGIESYIVDQITYVDQNSGAASSVHSYNIVNIDGKFYQVDPTIGTNISKISGGLSSNNFNKASSGINTSNFKFINTNEINNIYNQYKSGVGSNYNYIYPQDVTPNYGRHNLNGTKVDNNVTSNVVTNPSNNITNPTNNYPTSNNTYTYNTSYSTYTISDKPGVYYTPVTKVVEVTNEAGSVVATEIVTEYIEKPIEETTTHTQEVKGIDEDNTDNKTRLNIILISIAVLLVIILIISKIYNSNRNVKINLKDI